jgi:glycosyltransferase involved in cell wall biosynthesis
MDDYPFCSVVIPALNEQDCIERCLVSLNNQTYPRDKYEIIVVDNGSSDATQSIAAKYADRMLDKPGVNVGAVRNYGARHHATGDILICTDSDCLFDRAWIENGVNLLQSYPDHVFGGGLKSGDNSTWIERYWLLNDQGENTRQQKDLMGSCVFIWKSIFIEVGGFREDVTSGEDTELSKALVAMGKTVLIDKALSIVHLGNATTIAGFAKRQIWHAENYFKNIRQSLKDPVFYLALSFLILSCFSVVTFAAYPMLSLRLLVLALLLPVVLSAKRIIRARLDMLAFLTSVPLIYVLDLLYLVSRSIGLVKGILEFRHA